MALGSTMKASHGAPRAGAPVVAACSFALLGELAAAQTPSPAAADDPLQEIVVTGAHIRGVAGVVISSPGAATGGSRPMPRPVLPTATARIRRARCNSLDGIDPFSGNVPGRVVTVAVRA
jgi:hypothetical protein